MLWIGNFKAANVFKRYIMQNIGIFHLRHEQVIIHRSQAAACILHESAVE